VLPGPKPWPIIGNKIANDSVGILVDMQALYEKYKPRFVIYTGPQVRVVHSKPEHIAFIVTANAHTTKSENFDVLKGWIGEGLATSKGDKWRERRKMINQSFNMNLMERFMTVFNSASETLVKNLEQESGKDCTDILDYTNFSALEIACENLMGIKLKPEENEAERDYIEKTKVMLRIVGVRFFSFWQRYETLFLMFSKHSKIYLDYVGSLKKFTIGVIERRSKNFKDERKLQNTQNDFGIKKKAALMDILLEENERGNLDYRGHQRKLIHLWLLATRLPLGYFHSPYSNSPGIPMYSELFTKRLCR
ncbi:Cytochrome P450 4C1, partial [Gonioctena quinquepunctata]